MPPKFEVGRQCSIATRRDLPASFTSMPETRRKTIGPRRPCPCPKCNGALMSLTTVRNHRLRVQAEGFKNASNEDVKPVIKSEPQDATLSNATGRKRKRHKASENHNLPTASGVEQQMIVPSSTSANLPTNTVAASDYLKLHNTLLALQERCLTLERELQAERATKAHVIKHLDYMAEVLAPQPSQTYDLSDDVLQYPAMSPPPL